MADRKRAFEPLYAVPPGATLEELLGDRQMTQTELAKRMGRPLKTINEIVQGKAAIRPDTAIQLERVLGVPASFWTNLERQYREDQARVREIQALKTQAGWLERFPLKELRGLGHLPETRDRPTLLHFLLRFFSVGSVEAWENVWLRPAAAFRQSPVFKASQEATAAWLRAGALEAEQIECAPYDGRAFLSFLQKARLLTREDPADFNQPLIEGCRAAGVALVFLRPFTGTRAYGATQWVNPTKAVIQLSNRYKADDHLWFTFFHEAGHIVLHGNQGVFVEAKNVAAPGSDIAEDEANEFASETLIPRADWDHFLEHNPSTVSAVVSFAGKVGVSPGTVVGRLQHEGVWPYTQGNGLKKRFVLVDGDS
jgi:HTH-type transcriptional regulator/antitoxin HigA